MDEHGASTGLQAIFGNPNGGEETPLQGLYNDLLSCLVERQNVQCLDFLKFSMCKNFSNKHDFIYFMHIYSITGYQKQSMNDQTRLPLGMQLHQVI